jgi:hypothetical protein
MKKLTCTFFLVAALRSSLPAQERDDPDQVQLGSKVAETMLIHKEEPACQKDSDGVRVSGTVVIAITIDKNGKVSHPHTVSGPKILRPLAAATVLKYRYKPYLLIGTPIEVETVVSIQIDCFFHNGQA